MRAVCVGASWGWEGHVLAHLEQFGPGPPTAVGL